MKCCSVEGCTRKHFGRGYCALHHKRFWVHGDPLFVNPGGRKKGAYMPGLDASWHWHGDDVGYRTVHTRLWKARGRASEHQCVCGRQAEEWAYDHLDPDEKIGPNAPGTKPKPYSTNLDHYDPLCRKCHKAFDQVVA